MKAIKITLFSVIAAALLCGVGLAQSETNQPKKAFGVRSGYGSNPDQFVIGAQSVLGQAFGFVRFAPSVDLGFGDNMTTYLFNSDFRLLSFSPPDSPAGLYAGLGATIAVLDVSNYGSDTEIGLNAVAGVTLPMGQSNEYNLEVRFGFADMPDLRILFGVLFGGRSNTDSRTVQLTK